MTVIWNMSRIENRIRPRRLYFIPGLWPVANQAAKSTLASFPQCDARGCGRVNGQGSGGGGSGLQYPQTHNTANQEARRGKEDNRVNSVHDG